MFSSTDPFYYEKQAIQTAIDLETRSIKETDFQSRLKGFVVVVLSRSRSLSNSLKDLNKVKALIADFQIHYFSEEKPDIFSHRLMKKVTKHPPVENGFFTYAKIVTRQIIKPKGTETKLFDREDDWATHFVLAILDSNKLAHQMNFCAELPEEERFLFLLKKCDLAKELAELHGRKLFTRATAEELIDLLNSLRLESPYFSEKPVLEDSNPINYLLYRYETFIFEFPGYKEKIREALIWNLQSLLKLERF